MLYKWQCVINSIVVVNNGDYLNSIILSKDEMYIWVYTSSMGFVIMSCLNHICEYMLCATKLMQLMKNLVVRIIYN